MKPLHAPIFVTSGFAVNSAFDPVAVEKSAYVPPVPISSKSSSGMINHYWHKSFEEFLVKQARGSSVSRRETSLFFKWEKRDEQKAPTPLPYQIHDRLYREYARLCALPGIQQLNSRVDERYAQVSRDLIGSEDIDHLYSREKLLAFAGEA
jgi:hypothetical protein